jgi:hypothetical protein
MADNRNKDRIDKDRMDDKSNIYRLALSNDFYGFTIEEFKVFEEINYIGQDIHYTLGGFQTEKTYQEAFERELLLRTDQFTYFREFSMDIIYKDSKVGVAIPDFILIPDRDCFKLKNKELPAIIVELKQRSQTNEDTDIDYDRYMEDKSDLNKIGKRVPRQQLWKYLNSASISNNPAVNQVDVGVLINFSTNLETELVPTPLVRDEQGAHIEVWQMKETQRDIDGLAALAAKPNEMHLIYETFDKPVTRKDMIKMRKDIDST